MSVPGEHKTVQARILHYAAEIGWTVVPTAETERRRGFDASKPIAERARGASLFFEESLASQIRKFNPKFKGDPAGIIGDLARLPATIQGNRDFLTYLRNGRTFFSPKDRREYDLQLIDYVDPVRNIYEVTEEFRVNNGRHSIREDVVFLINGIPVLVIECKNANKAEALDLGVDQIRRYHREAPEVMVPEMLFTATDAIGFSYGVTWNTVRRNIFTWKSDEIGNLEQKVTTFCDIPHLLRFLKDFIIFAEKEEELQKFILRQHQATAVDRVVARSLESGRSRGLVWHTQGSGKTFTMIKTAELLFKAPKAEKPTVLLMIDRNELEDQMLRNLVALGLENVQHAHSIEHLNQLMRDDFRGIVVTMIHKFRNMPAKINERRNIYVLIDEAHRTTSGDLGTFLMAGLPNASLIGFTGTPVDKSAYGKGTFKTFGIEDEAGYLHKYSIAESIADGTTLPLYYNLAPNELRVPTEMLDKEFLSLVEAEGIADIEELNRLLDRAVNLKNFLKGKQRRAAVAKYVADHYVQNVEPLGYKAFLVGVDREACAFYKEELDKILPPEYSEVVYTANNNDAEHMKRWHVNEQREKQIRKDFKRVEAFPKILIVTEKLLTGFDAPLLYAMYLDKPMRDHTLLQAIARVNRPYETEEGDNRKPHGFVLDFIGIFENLEKALAFDSDEINAVVKDLALLKHLFASKMEQKAGAYLRLVTSGFNDKDVDNLIEHFRDKSTRSEFFREFKELEMLYEIISPDEFLREYLDDYASLAAMYGVVRNAFSHRVSVDREVLRKTNRLVQDHIGSYTTEMVGEFIKIDERTIQAIKDQQGGDSTKVINLVKLIEKTAEEESGDPFLIAMAERAKAIQESYEERQLSTSEALKSLLGTVEADQERKKQQAERGVDGITYFTYSKLIEIDFPNAENVAKQIGAAFVEHPYWSISEPELREVRKLATFALLGPDVDDATVSRLVEELFSVVQRVDPR